MTRKEREKLESVQSALRNRNWSLAWGYVELLLKDRKAA